MARNQLLKVHRSWEDWAGLALGILVLLSPWITDQSSNSAAVTSATLTGFLIIFLSGLEMMRLYRWHEIVALLAGAWLFVSPFMLGYATMTPLATWHFVLGAVVAFLALLEIWQDWGLSDDDLAAHGQ
jgi:SPW repeat